MSASRSNAVYQFFRSWYPRLLLTLVGLAVVALWLWPWERPARAERMFAIWMLIPIAVLLLEAWVLFFSGWTWVVRLIVLLLPFVALSAGASALREVRWSGDMVPQPIFRWDATQDEILDAHRQSKQEKPAWEPADPLGKYDERDFPEYRGLGRKGFAWQQTIAKDWKTSPPRLLWRHPVGGGYSGIAVSSNAAITLEQRHDREAVVCYDTATGKEVWEYSYPAHFVEKLGGPGPRATPTIHEGMVYSLGATGTLVCLDAATGKHLWTVNILTDNANLPWAMSGSPLVWEQMVIVNPGTQQDSAKDRALIAYDRKTGKEIWSTGNTRAGYCSPMVEHFADENKDLVLQLLIFDAEGVAGYEVDKGKELWRYPWKTHRDINVAQPLKLDFGRIFISSGYSVGCAMLQVTQENGQWSVKELWKNRAMHCKFSSPVAFQGHLFGLDEGVLVCVNEETGQRAWRGPRFGHGQMILAKEQERLLILSESGELVLVAATYSGYHELGRIQALEGKTWNYPALARGKAFVRNDKEIACYDLTSK